MDRGAWKATVPGVAESNMTEATENSSRFWNLSNLKLNL